jgi:hypothetical protein
MKKIFVPGAALLMLAFFLLGRCAAVSSVGGAVSDIIGMGTGSKNDQTRAAGGCGDAFDQTRAAGGCGNAFAGSNSSANSKGTGQSVNLSWPDSEWESYGLKGLKQPAGSTVGNIAIVQGVYYVSIENAGKEAYDDLIAQIKRITGARNPYSLVKSTEGELSEYQYGEHLVSLAADFINREIVVRILR